ncbi:MAG: DUF4160 domain-containing protein [Anaerolineae bacterium]|nr:DUF4160 domain-containing protein [Anaerolineae bacterium]MDQ7036681.1 DUF4160 domain-containing protein [Anaerolineae bacterium]
MSPTIIYKDGYRVTIFFNDHPPPHVHVTKDDGMARLGLNPVEMIDNEGLSRKELKTAIQIVESNRDILIAKWNQIHGSDENDTEIGNESTSE